MSRKHSLSNRQKYLLDAFKLFDKDKDGLISISELQHVLKSLNIIASEYQIQEMVNNVINPQ